MARPQPRSLGPSPLAGMSALTPVETPSETPATLRAVAEAAEAPTVASVGEVAASEPDKAPAHKPVSETAEEKKKKQSFYQTTSEANQARGAFRMTAHHEGFESLSDFIAKAVAEKVARLQEQYNGGRPFESFGANQIPKGRPLSS